MINFEEFIGLPVNKVIQILEKGNIKYRVERTCSNLKEFDTELVVQVQTDTNDLVLVVDKFILNI